MALVLWKDKNSYRSLHIVSTCWHIIAPINVKAHNFGGGHFGFELFIIGFNKYNNGWSFRLFNKKLVWVG